jgi:hypothetical protein
MRCRKGSWSYTGRAAEAIHTGTLAGVQRYSRVARAVEKGNRTRGKIASVRE